MIEIQRNVCSGQSYGCWLMVQVRFTRFMFRRWRDKNKQALHVYLAAPLHDPDKGYLCRKWGIGHLWKMGRLVFDAGYHQPGHGRLGVGHANWHAMHAWWRFYWVRRGR